VKSIQKTDTDIDEASPPHAPFMAKMLRPQSNKRGITLSNHLPRERT
jgi:hypothetical protein